jgi:hypothetical protein
MAKTSKCSHVNHVKMKVPTDTVDFAQVPCMVL